MTPIPNNRRVASSRLGVAAWLAGLLTGIVSGCDTSAPPPPPSPPRSEAERAQTQFSNIVDEVRRRLAELRPQQPTSIGGPLVSWTTEVTEKILPPAAEGLAWRGRVTVKTQSTVTVIDVPDDADSEPDEDRDSRKDDREGDPVDPEIAELDEVFGEAGGGGRGSLTRTPLIKEFPDERIEVYELIFEEGAWRLTTPPEKNTEMELIFPIAIKSQF